MFHQRLGASFQSCSNIWWMTCFWWQMTYDIAIHIMRVSLKEGCFEINVEKIPTFSCCHLAAHPKSRSCGSRGIGLKVILLLVLETSPSSLRPDEVALLVGLDGEYLSSGHIVLRFDLSQIKEIKNLWGESRISTRGVSLQHTACRADAFFRARDLHLALALAAFPQVPYVPACLWFDCQLLSGIQLVHCWNSRSLHRGTRIQQDYGDLELSSKTLFRGGQRTSASTTHQSLRGVSASRKASPR